MMPDVAIGSLLIRAAEDADAPELNRIYNHYVATSHVTFDIEPMDLDRRLAWLHARRNATHIALVALDTDRVLGFASSGPYRDRPAYETSVETTVYVDPRSTAQGVGRALYAELLERLSEQGVHRALAGVALPNPASIALHRRFGYTEVGRFSEQGRKFGRYWDVAWFERTLP